MRISYGDAEFTTMVPRPVAVDIPVELSWAAFSVARPAVTPPCMLIWPRISPLGFAGEVWTLKYSSPASNAAYWALVRNVPAGTVAVALSGARVRLMMGAPLPVGFPLGAWWMCCADGGVDVSPVKVMPPVISSVVGLTTTAPRPVPVAPVGGVSWAPVRDAERMTVAAAAAGMLDPPPPPPPQDATPTRTADTIKPIKMLRTFIMSISLRSVCYAAGITGSYQG